MCMFHNAVAGRVRAGVTSDALRLSVIKDR